MEASGTPARGTRGRASPACRKASRKIDGSRSERPKGDFGGPAQLNRDGVFPQTKEHLISV